MQYSTRTPRTPQTPRTPRTPVRELLAEGAAAAAAPHRRGGEDPNWNVIFDMINHRQWKAVVEYVKATPEAAQVTARRAITMNSDPQSSSSSSSSKRHNDHGQHHANWPLHEVCRLQPPLHVVNILLQAYHEAVQSPGQYGYLPLHVACGTGASLDVVTRLLEAYPSATRCRDVVDDALPLHLAAQYGSSEDVLMEILTTHPQGSFLRDASGNTPLDHAHALPESHTKSCVVTALETAPILVATAKAAACRVEREAEARLRGVQDAHQEFLRQLQQRHDDEQTEALQLEVAFHNELAAEKERNCELAEVVLDLQTRALHTQQDHDAVVRTLEGQLQRTQSQLARQQAELADILNPPPTSTSTGVSDSDSDSDSPTKGTSKAAATKRTLTGMSMSMSRSVPRSIATASPARSRRKSSYDEDGGDDNDNDNILLASSQSTTKNPLLLKVSQLSKRYQHAKSQLEQTQQDLQYQEEMVHHLNDLLSKKDLELTGLQSQSTHSQQQLDLTKERFEDLQVAHTEARQDLQSTRNDLHRWKRKAESSHQRLNDANRRVQDQKSRMANVTSLVASLSYNLDTWNGDENSHTIKDVSGVDELSDDEEREEEVEENTVDDHDHDDWDRDTSQDQQKPRTAMSKPNSSRQSSSRSIPRILEGMDKIRLCNVPTPTKKIHQGHRSIGMKGPKHHLSTTDDTVGLEVTVLKQKPSSDKSTGDSNDDTAATTKVHDYDDEDPDAYEENDGVDEEELSTLSQLSSPARGTTTIHRLIS